MAFEPRPQDAFRSLLQYQEVACFNEKCAATGTTAAPLKGCSRCKRVRYCSQACQNADFSVHKAFCKAFSALRAASPPIYPLSMFVDEDDTTAIGPFERNILLRDLSVEMDELVQGIGPRNMGKIANYLLFLEPRCLWCYRTKAHLTTDRQHEDGHTHVQNVGMVYCDDCMGATYCSVEHREKGRNAHAESMHGTGMTQCDIFKIAIQDDTFVRVWSTLPDRPGDIISWAPDRILPMPKTNPPTLPDLPSSWEAYYAVNSCPYTSNPSILRSMVSIGLSMPLTILGALHRFKIVPDPRMVVHVLGARVDFEMNYGGMAFEEIMHQLPWVQEIVVELIRPELGADNASEIPMECCPRCTRAGRKRTYKIANALYHEYFTRKRACKTPDLVVAFNSGLHESPDSWKPTIELLVSRNLSAVFTSYNSGEARADADEVVKMGARMLWKEEKNLWSGEKAHMDYFSEDLFWFENGYWMGFQGKA